MYKINRRRWSLVVQSKQQCLLMRLNDDLCLAVSPTAMRSRPPAPAPKPRKLASAANVSTESTTSGTAKPDAAQTAPSKSASNSPARLGSLQFHYVSALLQPCCLLDYCNCILASLPKCVNLLLLQVQNAAARLIFGLRPQDHVTSVLQQLHWLPIHYRIQYKLCLLMYSVCQQHCPVYISHRHSQGVQWVHLHPQGGEKFFLDIFCR